MSSPIEMRRYLAIMHGKEPVKSAKELVEETKKDMTMRDMLGKMRNLKNTPNLNLNENVQQLNEFVDAPSLDTNTMASPNNGQSDNSNNLATEIDKEEEQEKMNKYFSEPNVAIEYRDFLVKSDEVLLSGTINNAIEFVLVASADNNSEDVTVNYLDDFQAQDPKNEEIIKKLNDYHHDVFYKYWREQLFN